MWWSLGVVFVWLLHRLAEAFSAKAVFFFFFWNEDCSYHIVSCLSYPAGEDRFDPNY